MVENLILLIFLEFKINSQRKNVILVKNAHVDPFNHIYNLLNSEPHAQL